MYDPTVARLTYRALLGRRRAAILFVLPALLLVIAAAVRMFAGADDQIASDVLGGFAIATIVPLAGVSPGPDPPIPLPTVSRSPLSCSHSSRTARGRSAHGVGAPLRAATELRPTAPAATPSWPRPSADLLVSALVRNSPAEPEALVQGPLLYVSLPGPPAPAPGSPDAEARRIAGPSPVGPNMSCQRSASNTTLPVCPRSPSGP